MGFFKRTLPGLAASRMSEGAPGPEAPSQLFRDWQRISTQTSVKAKTPETANGCMVLRPSRNLRNALEKHLPKNKQRALRARNGDPRFLLTLLIMDV
jgi:hypothetical protein